jgi:hypothetical protein
MMVKTQIPDGRNNNPNPAPVVSSTNGTTKKRHAKSVGHYLIGRS